MDGAEPRLNAFRAACSAIDGPDGPFGSGGAIGTRPGGLGAEDPGTGGADAGGGTSPDNDGLRDDGGGSGGFFPTGGGGFALKVDPSEDTDAVDVGRSLLCNMLIDGTTGAAPGGGGGGAPPGTLGTAGACDLIVSGSDR
jgi:hypothetical protein